MEYESLPVVPHKAASVSSTTSNDPPPSLYSGSSVCDADSPMLQEPGPFEDFQYSAGIDPSLAIHIPHDISLPDDDKVLLTENDQKTFDEFLNTFAMEENDQKTMPEHVTIPVSIPSPVVPAFQLDDDQQQQQGSRKRPASPSSSSADEQRAPSPKRSKSGTRELLTEEEKRANHIASEQKRRNTIRKGFKEMTEIVPTLKNINNSKSTILFKAVEYIKHLDKRNRNLREKIASLQMRVEVKRRMGALGGGSGRSDASSSPLSSWTIPAVSFRRNTFAATTSPVPHETVFRRTSDAVINGNSDLPPHTMAALLVHKNQQKQLELLQEQLALRRGFQPWSSSSSSSSSYNAISIPASTFDDNPAHPLSYSTTSSNYQHTPPTHRLSSSSSTSSNPPSTVNTTGISSSYAPTAALVVPMTDDDRCVTPAQTTTSVMGTPCLTIPADEEFDKMATQHNGLLSCAKFGNHHHNNKKQ